MVEHMRVGGATLAYSVLGRGPGLLVPWCNHPWLDMPYLAALAEHRTVVVASPRGYQASTRLTEPDRYSADLLVSDLLAVCDRTGLERFSVLGYSLTAAMGAWLAGTSDRVDALVAGGFPLLGSYLAVLERAERDVEAMTANDEVSLRAQFDPEAALAFYRELAARADGALVAGLHCPALAFWGSGDELLDSFNVVADYEGGLTGQGIATLTLAGHDHTTAVVGFGAIVPEVVEWLDATRA